MVNHGKPRGFRKIGDFLMDLPSGKLTHRTRGCPFGTTPRPTRVWPGRPYPRAELATHWFHYPSARGFPCHNNSDVLHILLLGVSFRVYIS